MGVAVGHAANVLRVMFSLAQRTEHDLDARTVLVVEDGVHMRISRTESIGENPDWVSIQAVHMGHQADRLRKKLGVVWG